MTKGEFIALAKEHYISELQRLQITSDKTSSFEADIDKFNSCIDDTSNRLNLRLVSGGKYSKTLLNQIARHLCSLGEMFENKETTKGYKYIEYYNALEIIDTISLVETDKISGEQFVRSASLKGLYKIHHNAFSGLGYSLIRNIKEYWFNGKNELRPEKEVELDEIINQLGKSGIAAVLNGMHNKVYIKKLKGEWIIYALHEGIKYYLCLATHNEGDENIFENKIKSCYADFPELIKL